MSKLETTKRQASHITLNTQNPPYLEGSTRMLRKNQTVPVSHIAHVKLINLRKYKCANKSLSVMSQNKVVWEMKQISSQIWNRYLLPIRQKYFNVTTKSHWSNIIYVSKTNFQGNYNRYTEYRDNWETMCLLNFERVGSQNINIIFYFDLNFLITFPSPPKKNKIKKK